MGYTHFDKVSGVNGLYKGAKGSEVLVTGSEGVITLNVALATTDASDQYLTVPYNASFSGYAAFGSSAGTGRAVVISQAGTEVGKTAVTGANGTVGAPIAITGSANITAGSLLKVAIASCATAQVSCGVTLILTKV